MKYLNVNETDFSVTIRRYLESELLDDQYAKLSQGGYTDANAIPLSRVFVDLPVEFHSERALNRPKTDHGDQRDDNLEDSDTGSTKRGKGPGRPFSSCYLKKAGKC